MAVQVDQTRNDGLSRCVHDLGTVWNRDGVTSAGCLDASVAHEHHRVIDRRAAGPVD